MVELVEDINGWIDERTPAFVDPGSTFIKVKSSRGLDRLDALSQDIPDSIWRRWTTFGILFTGVSMAVVTAAILWLTGWGVGQLIQAALSFDFNSASVGVTDFELRPIYWLGQAATGWVYYHALILVVLPGLVLHEFGHYVSLVKNGVAVESYGLLFFGPVLVGAYVQPEDSETQPELTTRQELEIFSAGIVQNVGWGTCLLLIAGVLIVTAPGGFAAILDVYNTPGARWTWRQSSGVLFGLVGSAEYLGGISNAAPVPYLDGGHYAKALLNRWWSFDEALDRVRLGAGGGSR